MSHNTTDVFSDLPSSPSIVFEPLKQIFTELILRNQQLNDKVDRQYQHFTNELETMQDQMQHIKAENQQLKMQINESKTQIDQRLQKSDEIHNRQWLELTQKLDEHVTDMTNRWKQEEDGKIINKTSQNDLIQLKERVNQLQSDVQHHQNALGQLDIINYNVKRLMHQTYLAGMMHIPSNARWKQNAITIAGGRGGGEALHQLYYPHGLCLDDRDSSLFIADKDNHRIVAWKKGDNTGRLVIGGHGEGKRSDQLNGPTDVLLDKENDSLIICDRYNRRVTRWSLRSGTTQGHTIIDNIACFGLAMDKEGHLYVTDVEKHEVRRYERGDKTKNTLVAGGNGYGDSLNQLNSPFYVFVDDEDAVYVSDYFNHRVIKWVKGTTEGIVVAGGRGQGKDLTQLSYPEGVFVDADGTVYVAELGNHRVTRWCKGMEKGEIIVGGNGWGEGANQFNSPIGFSFDRHGHLYVADINNHRVQRFDLL